MSAQEVFVYYRVGVADADAQLAAATRMQRALRDAHPGLNARLLRRPEHADGLHTWMEAYRLPEGADEQALLASIDRAAAALAGWQVGPRHVERFVACAS